MLAEALEVEGLSIDEELCSYYLYGADAEFLSVFIFSKANPQAVEIWILRPWIPEMGIGDTDFSSVLYTENFIDCVSEAT